MVLCCAVLDLSMLSLSSIRAMKGYERGVSDKLPGVACRCSKQVFHVEYQFSVPCSYSYPHHTVVGERFMDPERRYWLGAKFKYGFGSSR